MQIQLFIDKEFGFDVAMFQLSELRRLAGELAEFVSLDIETEDLKAADDYTVRQTKSGGGLRR